MNTKPLTTLQKATYDYCLWFFRENHQLPPAYVSASHFNVNINAIVDRMAVLEKKGHVKKNWLGKYMFTQLKG